MEKNLPVSNTIALPISPMGPAVELKRLPFNTLPLPQYTTAGAAAFDVMACLTDSVASVLAYKKDPKSVFIDLDPYLKTPASMTAPGFHKLIPTGWAIALQRGYDLSVRPRSGLPNKHMLFIPNAPGTVDDDYRGPLMIGLLNFGHHRYRIYHGDRIAQCIIRPTLRANICEVQEFSDAITGRGDGGFGSTGR